MATFLRGPWECGALRPGLGMFGLGGSCSAKVSVFVLFQNRRAASVVSRVLVQCQPFRQIPRTAVRRASCFDTVGGEQTLDFWIFGLSNSTWELNEKCAVTGCYKPNSLANGAVRCFCCERVRRRSSLFGFVCGDNVSACRTQVDARLFCSTGRCFCVSSRKHRTCRKRLRQAVGDGT